MSNYVGSSPCGPTNSFESGGTWCCIEPRPLGPITEPEFPAVVMTLGPCHCLNGIWVAARWVAADTCCTCCRVVFDPASAQVSGNQEREERGRITLLLRFLPE